MKSFLQTTTINAPREFAFNWHKQPGAFERLGPPWENLRMGKKTGGLEDGARLSFYIVKGPAKIKWVAEHVDYKEGEQFADFAVKGPIPDWKHYHRFEEVDSTTTTLIDDLEFSKPFGPLGSAIPRCLMEEKIEGMFAYRGHVTKHDIERHYKAALEPQRILIAGSSGFVGSSLIPFLKTGGHQVVRALRSKRSVEEESIVYNPSQEISPQALEKLEGIDAVVNLAGESIFGIWSEAKKNRIRDSRVLTTKHLSEALAKMKKKPKVLINASAIGFYGNSGSQELNEESAAGKGFLADVAKEWEEATQPASDAGIRVINLRIGIVLSPDGGMLKLMVPGVLTGLAGQLGDGTHWRRWTTKNDLVGLIHHCLYNESVEGPVNATSPNPVTNKQFTKIIGRVLNRPTFLSVPSFVLKTAAPDLSRDVFLGSVKAMPTKAMEHDFEFMDPELESALRIMLGRERRARVKNK